MARTPKVIRVLVCDREARTFEELDEAEIDDVTVKIVGWAQSTPEFDQALNSLNPDIIVMDMDNPSLDASEQLRQVFLNSLPVGVVVVFDQQDTQRVRSAMRLGVDDFLVRPVAPEALAGSIANVFTGVVSRYPEGWKEPEVSAAAEGQQEGAGKVIVVTSGKAGVGKTTIGTNLALAIARETQKKTVLLDLDHGDSALLLDLHPERALTEIADAIEQLDANELVNYCSPHSSGINLIVGSNDPEVRDLDLLKPEALEYVIALLRRQFDYIVVSLPLLANEAELRLVLQAHQILCVTTARDLLDLRATRAYLGRLRNLSASIADRLRVVANAVNLSRFIGEDELTKTLGFTLGAIVPQNEELAVASVNAGHPFVMSAPTNPLSEAVITLGRRVTGLPVQTEGRGSRGFFGLFRA